MSPDVRLDAMPTISANITPAVIKASVNGSEVIRVNVTNVSVKTTTVENILRASIKSTGPQGATGATGATGQGVPVGGTTNQALIKNSNTDYDTKWSSVVSGSGDTVGPSSSTDNAIVRFNGITGKLVQNSGVIIDDSGNVIMPNNVGFIGTDTTNTTATLFVLDNTDTLQIGNGYPTNFPTNVTVNGDGTYSFGANALLAPNETVIFRTNDTDRFTVDANGTVNITPDSGYGVNIGSNLSFSGTTIAGLELNSLTTTQRNALTPANGMVINNSTLNQFNKYENGQWVDVSKSPATKVVAPAGSGIAADYYTDGTADDVEINAALTAINSTGGGTLLIKKGIYNLTAQIPLYSNITIKGEGIGKTILKTATYSGDLFAIGSSLGTNSGSDPAGTYTNISFYDFEINAQTTGGTGIALHGTNNINIERVSMHDSSNFGIYMANPTYLWIKDCYVNNINLNGAIQLKGAFHAWVENTYVNGVTGSLAGLSKGIGSHATDGVNARVGEDVHIINNFVNNADFGIDCEDNYSEVSGNTVLNFAVNGIEARNNPISLTIAHNRVSQSTAGSANGISLFYATSGMVDIVIDGNIVENVNSDTSSNGVFLGTSAANVIFSNNIVSNSGRYGVQNRSTRVTTVGNKYYSNTTAGFFNDGGSNSPLDPSQDTTTGAGALMVIKTQDATTNLANISAGELRLQTGLGIGNAGNVISFYTSTDTSSGITVQTATEKMRLVNSTNGRLLLGTTSGSADGIVMGGAVARSLLVVRHPTSNTAGNNLTLQAGGATSQATNKSGGTLILSSGIATGSGTSQILLKTFPATSSSLATLSSVSVNVGGSGYVASDVLTITGGGGSSGTATVATVGASGELKTIAINAGGASYVNGDVLTVSGGTGGTVTVNTVDSTGKILIATLTTGGTGYTGATGAATTGGTGTGGKFNTTIYATGEIKTISLTNAGTGYALTTGATTSGGTGTLATLNIVPFDNVDNTATTAVTISSAGNMTVVGTVGASNFSGTSSGTNTGDQTLSGLGGAPVGSTYVTISSDATLTNERALTGTTNQITLTDNGANSTVVVSIATGYVGQSSITTLGTITTGVWSGTAIDHTKLTGIVQSDIGGLTTASTPTFAGLSLGTGSLNTVGNIEIDATAARDITVGTGVDGAVGTLLLVKSGTVLSGGTSTDKAAGELRLSTGAATGNANTVISFYTSTPGSSGTAAQTISEKMRLFGSSNGRLSLGTTTGTFDGINLGGNVARTIASIRHSTANTAGNTLTIQSGGATSGATDKPAGALILASGLATGVGVSNVQMQVSAPVDSSAVPLASGTTDGILITRQVVGAFKALTKSSAIALVNCTVASNTVIGGIIRYAIEVFDGTNLQMETGEITYQCANKGGVFSGNTITQSGSAKQFLGSGTLATTFAISGANPAVISCNSVPTLTPSSGYPRITYTIENLTQQGISIQ